MLQGRCEVFLTIDRGFEYQHKLASLDYGIVIVHVTKNRIGDYEAVREEIVGALDVIRPGEVLHVLQSNDE